MIVFVDGDIFASGADVLVNPVNCVGVSGVGLALEFKRRFPVAQSSYERACRNGELRPGGVYHAMPGIVCLATKGHWRTPSKLRWVRQGLNNLARLVDELHRNGQTIQSIALPALGCGCGRLDWRGVQAEIISRLRDVPCGVLAFKPHRKT